MAEVVFERGRPLKNREDLELLQLVLMDDMARSLKELQRTESKEDQERDLTKAIEYDSNHNPLYIGEARPNTAKSDAGWRIKKIIYDANNNPIDIQWASGDQNFNKIWNSRGHYAYV